NNQRCSFGAKEPATAATPASSAATPSCRRFKVCGFQMVSPGNPQISNVRRGDLRQGREPHATGIVAVCWPFRDGGPLCIRQAGNTRNANACRNYADLPGLTHVRSSSWVISPREGIHDLLY